VQYGEKGKKTSSRVSGYHSINITMSGLAQVGGGGGGGKCMRKSIPKGHKDA